jgi:hypothetical protein
MLSNMAEIKHKRDLKKKKFTFEWSFVYWKSITCYHRELILSNVEYVQGQKVQHLTENIQYINHTFEWGFINCLAKYCWKCILNESPRGISNA